MSAIVLYFGLRLALLLLLLLLAVFLFPCCWDCSFRGCFVDNKASDDVFRCNRLLVRGCVGDKKAEQLLLDRSMTESNAIMV